MFRLASQGTDSFSKTSSPLRERIEVRVMQLTIPLTLALSRKGRGNEHPFASPWLLQP
jgi:hypothetical protein